MIQPLSEVVHLQRVRLAYMRRDPNNVALHGLGTLSTLPLFRAWLRVVYLLIMTVLLSLLRRP